MPTHKTKAWLKERAYLPRFMRDFHDQKDLFKAVEETMGRDPEPYGVDWMRGQIYVIDHFLHFMAAHGYSLQRTRADVETADIQVTIKEANAARLAAIRLPK